MRQMFKKSIKMIKNFNILRRNFLNNIYRLIDDIFQVNIKKYGIFHLLEIFILLEILRFYKNLNHL